MKKTRRVMRVRKRSVCSTFKADTGNIAGLLKPGTNLLTLDHLDALEYTFNVQNAVSHKIRSIGNAALVVNVLRVVANA